MKILTKIALVLVLIGGLNWGLIGFFKFNLVQALFNGNLAWIASVIYALVGVSTLIVATSEIMKATNM